MENLNDSLIVQINGRDALPVRAIPYVTGWKLSPYDLAKHLAKVAKAEFAKLKTTSAFHSHSGTPVNILPKEWDSTVAAFAGLVASLKDEFSNQDKAYAQWRIEAVAILPSGIFVWLDDFKRDWQLDFSRASFIPAEKEERLGERDLTFAPMMSREVRQMVLEGFVKHVDALEAITQSASLGTANNYAPPLQRTKAQDAAILAVIAGLGHNPLALPRNDSGKPGVKAKVCAALGKTGMWSGSTVFDKAWERLSRNGDIKIINGK